MLKHAVAAFAAAGLLATGALAQNTTSPSTSPSTGAAAGGSAMKLSQSECTDLWQRAGGSASGLTQEQAKPHVSNFKAANPDGDTTIDQNEWMTACNKGLVKSTAASGASTGAAGSSANEGRDQHPPTNRMNEKVPDMKPHSAN